MIPTTQTKFRDDATGERGNCVSAVVASLLHLPIESVPMFVSPDWRRELNEFLRPYGLAFLALDQEDPARLRVVHGIEGLYHASFGTSPRNANVRHACVGVDGDVAFDPHPDRSGLDPAHKIDDYPGVFVVLEPWRHIASKPAPADETHVIGTAGTADSTYFRRELDYLRERLPNADGPWLARYLARLAAVAGASVDAGVLVVDKDAHAWLGSVIEIMDNLSMHNKPVGKRTWEASNAFDALLDSVSDNNATAPEVK